MMLQVATYPFLYRSGFDSILYWLLKESSPKAFFFLVAKHKSLKMNPEKRRSIESFFLSSNKKSRNDDQKTETNVTTSSPSSTSESKNPPPTSPSNSNDQVMCDNASDTVSSSFSTSFSLNESFGKSVPKDISTSCHDPPAQPQLPNYPLNHQKRSFQSNSSRSIQIRKNRDRLIKICSTLHLMARQMISFRGHDESERSSNRGNFLEILHWAAITDPVVQSIFQDSTSNASYLSHDIQNELIHIMSTQIREDISSMLTNCNYALMADECKDISGRQQLSIVIRFIGDLNNRRIDTSNVVKEYFLGLVALDKFDAETLANKIVDFLNNLNIPLESCICLCFDGASVMSGCHAGVHVLLRKYMPKSIYIHCSARLSKCSLIRNYDVNIDDLYFDNIHFGDLVFR
ncbi:unnamed protein product [Rotaria magnacalcarata]|uniref:DUF4371 domain-containing protein n=2 Tax=Rotaria magnacalcarata TaxID=392030 RepID=A0A820E7S0_9BILA|nr:unnamed protein product [Rotaria magnacalcarata]